ncbi:MAG TPA: hypothetical protein VFV38_21280 [Ktedonobacteraceae bacterium]|nr:hypothetical protein [Ktedonobacteraceae bacterium]
MNKKILILTQEVDPHVLPVARALQSRGAHVLRFDLRDFPERIQLAASIGPHGWQGPLTWSGQTVMLSTIHSIWYRRPTLPDAPKAYPPYVREFLNLENLRGLLGVLQGGEQGPFFWVSQRDRIQAAEYKPVQLSAAHALGLSVPRTLLTNQPAAAQAFFEACQGKVVCKAVARGIIDPHRVYLEKEEPRFLFTSRVLPQDLEASEQIQVCAHFFQELLPKAMDLRIVVIGRHVFPIGIHAHSEQAALDWRRSYGDVSYSVEQLPDEIKQKLLQLVRHFGLQYSSADFILTPSGDYYFIELNPNGQFYWTEPPTGLPMAEAMADLLCFPEEHHLC